MRFRLVAVLALLLAVPAWVQALETNPSCTAGASGLNSCYEGSPVPTNNCWQTTLHSTSYSAAAYRDIRLKVTFSRPGEASFSTYAYWDTLIVPPETPDHDVFRIRAMFPSPGTWTYNLTCEAGPCGEGSGLSNSDNPSRTVQVEAYTSQLGENALFEKGPLTQPPAASGWRSIRHTNGDFFYWVGDTAWAATLRALPQEWVAYVNNRKAKGFTVTHLAIAPEWAGGCWEAEEGQPEVWPFNDETECRPPAQAKAPAEDEEGGVDRPIPEPLPPIPANDSTPRHEFFERLASYVQTANCQGLVAFVVGVMEPVNRLPDSEDAALFARNLAGRLAGNHVIFSPGFDDPIFAECENGVPPLVDDENYSDSDRLIRAVGDIIAETAPRHLILNHPGTNGKAQFADDVSTTVDRLCAITAGKPWYKLAPYQSGFAGGNLNRITNRPLRLAQGLRGYDSQLPGFSTVRRPTINLEAIYDYGYDAADLAPVHWNRFRARQAGYLSWLAGATGYSFGASGIWEWGYCNDNAPPEGAPLWCDPVLGDSPQAIGEFLNFSTAMNANSSRDMKRMGEGLRGLAMSGLVTNEQGRILN